MAGIEFITKVVSSETISVQKMYSNLAEGTKIEIIVTDPQGKKESGLYTVPSGKVVDFVEIFVDGKLV